jgi:hypothetical protein
LAKVFTHQDIHDILQAHYESDLPDKVLACLLPHNGKLVGKNLLKSLPEVPGGWRIRRAYGMTHLESAPYMNGDLSNPKAVSLLLAHSEANVYVDTYSIEERNPAYFSGRRERNHARMEAMNTKHELDAMADAMTEASAALERFETAKARFAQLTACGKHFEPDSYELERACGLREPRK